MVERSLSMREVAGSMPAFSSSFLTADIYSTVLLKGERISTKDFYRCTSDKIIKEELSFIRLMKTWLSVFLGNFSSSLHLHFWPLTAIVLSLIDKNSNICLYKQ